MTDRIFVCPPASVEHLPLNTILGVGFGIVEVKKGTTLIWEGDSEVVTLDGFDRAASVLTEDGIPWRVVFNGPMVKETYRRQPDGENWVWALEKREDGFV